jgi:hypothetical protein
MSQGPKHVNAVACLKHREISGAGANDGKYHAEGIILDSGHTEGTRHHTGAVLCVEIDELPRCGVSRDV